MKAIITNLYTPDITEDLAEYSPPERDNFGLFMQMVISPIGGEGNEFFGFTWCTAKYLAEKTAKEKIIFGRHYVIVDEYDYAALEKKLNDYINAIDELTWDLLTDKVSRVAQSEFEDYNL
jgi:hypothetical protein